MGQSQVGVALGQVFPIAEVAVSADYKSGALVQRMQKWRPLGFRKLGKRKKAPSEGMCDKENWDSCWGRSWCWVLGVSS